MIDVHIETLKTDMPEVADVAVITYQGMTMTIPVSEANMLKRILSDLL